MTSIVNSFDEWTQLREVIVGNVDNFSSFHLDNSFCLFYWDNLKKYLYEKDFFKNKKGDYKWPYISIEKKIINELNEDIEEFVTVLKKQGIIVKRPSSISTVHSIQTPFWQSIQNPPLNVRDQVIILGTNIVETSPHVRSRLFENDYLKSHFLNYFKSGSNWISMPRPSLSKNSIDSTFNKLNKKEKEFLSENRILKNGNLDNELIFDGAQCIRIGKDVIVNVANANHELGYIWLCNNFSHTFNFHKLDKITDSHIDSIFLPLRPGTWLIRDIKYKKYLPKFLQDWEFIVAPKARKDYFPSYSSAKLSISSKFIDMNVLSINEKTVIVNSLFPELVELLEKKNYSVLPVQHRHRRLFGGGFHCFSLDIRRDGSLISYK